MFDGLHEHCPSTMMRSRWRASSAIAFAIVHFASYLGLLGAAIAQFEMAPRQETPAIVLYAVAILGFPLMHVPEGWLIGLRAFFGNDSRTLFGLAALNAGIWGLALYVVLHKLAGRRITEPASE